MSDKEFWSRRERARARAVRGVQHTALFLYVLAHAIKWTILPFASLWSMGYIDDDVALIILYGALPIVLGVLVNFWLAYLEMSWWQSKNIFRARWRELCDR